MKPSAALERLQAMCAAAEMCSSEARKKLERWEIPPAKSTLILRLLQRDKFIDNRRFALAYAREKLVYSNWGRQKIRQGLWGKEIPRPLIDEAIEALDPEEYIQAAQRTVDAKRSQLGPSVADSRAGREKIFRFAASRGFELSLIAELLSSH